MFAVFPLATIAVDFDAGVGVVLVDDHWWKLLVLLVINVDVDDGAFELALDVSLLTGVGVGTSWRISL